MSECRCGIEEQEPNFMKAKLEFNTATVDGQLAFEQAWAGTKLSSLLYSFDQELRSLVKYGGLQDEEDNDGAYDEKFSELKDPNPESCCLRPDAANAVDAVRTLLWRMINNRGLRDVVEA